MEDDKDNGIVCRAAKVYRAAWCKPADECSIVDGDGTMSNALLFAAQIVVKRYQAGLGIEDAAYALAKIVAQLEDEMGQEAMWYEHQYENAAKEYDKMMKELIG